MIYYIGTFIALALVILLLCHSIGSEKLEHFIVSPTTQKQDLYRQVLGMCKEALDELEIPFFLSSGSCLGYIREKNFIEHDHDLDIGIDADDYKPELINKLREKGLYLYRVFGTFNTGLELSFYLPYIPGHRRIRMSIFIYQPHRGTQTCWCSYDQENQTKVQYCVSKFDLEEVDFMGLKINIPDKAKQYLEELYGKNWRIPQAKDPQEDHNSPLSVIHKRDSDLWYEDF